MIRKTEIQLTYNFRSVWEPPVRFDHLSARRSGLEVAQRSLRHLEVAHHLIDPPERHLTTLAYARWAMLCPAMTGDFIALELG